MKLRLIALFALAALLAGCTFALSEDITPPPGYQSPTPPPDLGDLYPAEPPSPAAGAALYAGKCLACHGETGLGNGPMASSLPVTIPAIGLREVYSQGAPADQYSLVTQGRLDRGMPSFQDLSDQERWDVLAYVYTMNLPADELARGEELYVANCAQCHGPQGDLNAAANLTDPQFMAGQSGTAMFRAISEGIPPSMPALGGQLSEDEILTIVDYTRTLAFDMSVPAEPTPVPPTATAEAAAAETSAPTAEVSATSEAEGTPGAETTPAAGTEIVAADPTPEAPTTATIAGTVTNGSGGPLPEGLAAILHSYDQISAQEIGSLATEVTHGSYLFAEVPVGEQIVYLVTIDYQDVSYGSEPAFYDGATTSFDLPVTVYEASSDFSSIQLLQSHIIVNPPQDGMVTIVEIFVFANTTDRSVIFGIDEAGISFLPAPQGATVQSLQYSETSLPFSPAGSEQYAIVPSMEGQYGIVAIYSLPYDGELAFEQPLQIATTDLTLLIPDGMRLRDHNLNDSGLTDFQGQSFHQYEAGNLPGGETLSFTLKGMPGETGLLPLTRENGVIIGMGALGVILIVAGIYLYLRDRARARMEGEELDEEEDALGDDPEAILDAIIVLDAQFKSGSISKEAYEERRLALKARLKDIS